MDTVNAQASETTTEATGIPAQKKALLKKAGKIAGAVAGFALFCVAGVFAAKRFSSNSADTTADTGSEVPA